MAEEMVEYNGKMVPISDLRFEWHTGNAGVYARLGLSPSKEKVTAAPADIGDEEAAPEKPKGFSFKKEQTLKGVNE